MFIIGNTGCKADGNSLDYVLNFSVNLKLF